MCTVKLSWVFKKIRYKFKSSCFLLNNPLCNQVGEFIADDTFWP